MSSTAQALTIVERVEQSAVVAALDAKSAALMDLLPDEAAVSRFKRGVIVAITKNPDLMNCTPDSIVMACFEAASQGLEPTGAAGGAHLVPYKVNGQKVAQLIPDYRGVIRLITKPGSEVIAVEANVVKEGDEFNYQLGSDAWVNHVPALMSDRSTRASTHAYAVFRLRSGGAIVTVEDRAGIERIRKRGANSSSSPWTTDWDEMAKKTMVKRGSKLCPVSSEVRALVIREDELADANDGPAAPAPTGPTKASRLGARLRNVTPSDAPGADETAAQLPESAPNDDAAGEPSEPAEAPASLTREELLSALNELHVTTAAALEKAGELWPDRSPTTELTGVQRAELVVALRAEQAAAAL